MSLKSFKLSFYLKPMPNSQIKQSFKGVTIATSQNKENFQRLVLPTSKKQREFSTILPCSPFRTKNIFQGLPWRPCKGQMELDQVGKGE
jgi:hypothetical protein